MLEIRNLRKEYPNVVPIKDLSTTINKGEVISVIGPSGTGKSTLLRMMNMLEKPTSGHIIFDGMDITDPNCQLNLVRQKIGMIFQGYYMFNNMTIIENVCYAPVKLLGLSKREAYEKGMKLLEKVGLSYFALSYPEQLSGGQRQRASIAMTLAMEPEIVLFDEPTSALDPAMVGDVQAVIKDLAESGYTMIIVTHDMKFAETVANRVLYLDEGGIYEDDTPEVIFNNPKREKTREFVKASKNQTIEVKSIKNTFGVYMDDIEQFCMKNDVPRTMERRLKIVFEEYIFQLNKPFFKEGESVINCMLSYFPEKGTCTMVFTDNGKVNFKLNLERDQAVLAILQTQATTTSYDSDGDFIKDTFTFE